MVIPKTKIQHNLMKKYIYCHNIMHLTLWVGVWKLWIILKVEIMLFPDWSFPRVCICLLWQFRGRQDSQEWVCGHGNWWAQHQGRLQPDWTPPHPHPWYIHGQAYVSRNKTFESAVWWIRWQKCVKIAWTMHSSLSCNCFWWTIYSWLNFFF